MKQKFCSALGPDGFVRVHYTEWGDPENPRVVACAHGLTRNARDFDWLAQALAADYRVVCIDFPGRGHSDWLADSKGYNVAFYAGLSATWLAAVGGAQVHWLGTSMGGLVGMWLAAQPQVPLCSLILNDVGPEVPAVAMTRIADYLGTDFRFDTLRALETHLRMVHAPFGPLSDAQWAHLANHSHRQLADDRFAFHYDPRIAEAFAKAASAGVDLWPLWRDNRLPTLLLQGAESDVLPAALSERMLASQPTCELARIAGVGHAPALMDDAQIKLIDGWLTAQGGSAPTSTQTAGSAR
jgi:pimeloyl-ACP methyl ester carboxylesterase